MLRWFDFECSDCQHRWDTLVDVPFGGELQRAYKLTCPECLTTGRKLRVPSIPAPYMGERVQNPQVSGGAFDTMGMRKPPRLPDIPDGAKGEDVREVVHSREFQEIKKQRAEIRKQNAMKRKRAAALKRGEVVNMRRDRLPGDPDFRRS